MNDEKGEGKVCERRRIKKIVLTKPLQKPEESKKKVNVIKKRSFQRRKASATHSPSGSIMSFSLRYIDRDIYLVIYIS